MPSLAYAIMNVSYETSKKFKAEQNYDAAFDASLIENLVNNIHHGCYDKEWVPRFVEICENHPSKETEGFSKVYREALALIRVEGHTPTLHD